MAILEWADASLRGYLAGVERGVLYRNGLPGIPWNGLVSIKEENSGGEAGTNHIDGQKYQSSAKREDFAATVTAITYPEAFGDILENFQTQVMQQPFGMCYRTRSAESAEGYELHLVYNCYAEPTNRDYVTVNAQTDLATFSWSITTLPEIFPYLNASSHIIVKSLTAKSAVVEAIEDILYGTRWTPPSLPTIPELVGIFEANATLTITDNGDGTWTAEGPDEIVHMISSDVFEISWNSAIYLNADTYIVSTY